MEALIIFILAMLLVWGAWGLFKFVITNLMAIFWTSMFIFAAYCFLASSA